MPSRNVALKLNDIREHRCAFHIPTLLRLLKGVEALPDGATGALVFTAKDMPQGTVLIEDNRVCWAAASSMEHRLTDILRNQSDPPVSAETLEQIYDECYRDKIPLGEALVERGIVTPEGLWRGLRQHTAEAIALLATAQRISPVWASNRQRRYDAQYTYSTVDLLSCVGSFGWEEEARDAEETLREIIPKSAVGIAFLAEGRNGLPVAQVAADDWDCNSLIELGDWAINALADEEEEEAETIVELADGTAHQRAWRAGDIIYVRWSRRP